MVWLRTANIKKFDLFGAFNEHEVLDWTKGPFKVNKGDIVYLYVGVPYSKIMIKTVCINSSVTGDEVIDDRKFWANPDEFSASKEFIRLKLLQKIDDEKLSIDTLNSFHLISGRI